MVRKKKEDDGDEHGGVLKPDPNPGRPRFKGGKQKRRDQRFGISDDDFWAWWHRVRKKELGGRDGTKDDIIEAPRDWTSTRKPKRK